MIKKTMINEVITYEYPPDGEELPIIDPYEGCTMGCPYCFQLNDDEWNKDIIVKTNIANMIAMKLSDWPKDRIIYIGSKCDPYMNIEEKYELTRQCIIELSKLKIPIMITTKSNLDIIFRDIDIIKGYSADITVLLGLSNLNELSSNINSYDIKNIEMANKLHGLGIKVGAFITPILPGITDVNAMIDKLHNDIPVFLDKLRIDKTSKSGEKMINYITEKYPQLKETYENILYNDSNDYINNLRETWKENTRVNFVFD